VRNHGGARKGAGRPRIGSPIDCIRVLEDPTQSMAQKDRAALRLAHFRWTRAANQAFRRWSGADFLEIKRKIREEMWNALLIGLPRMAERGDVWQAWLAYRMISGVRLGNLAPPREMLPKVRLLAPQGARALWRISMTNDPKVYKSTKFLKVRRQARTALCKGIGIPVSKQLVRVEGSGFARLLLETIAAIRPSLSPEQAVTLAAWGNRKQGMGFIKSGCKIGVFRIVASKG
jgi:hypothetical protein